MNAAATALRIRGLVGDVGKAPRTRRLFEGLDAEFPPGTLTAIIGPNGAGKSTLLEMLCGLRPPTSGTVEFEGRELAGLPPRQRARSIAFLPQLTQLHFDLRVSDLVMLGRRPHRTRWGHPSSDDQRHVDASLAAVDASDLRGRKIRSLSGGERQRVMLARMLATEAPVLVLDEPNTGLDIGHALEVIELLQSLQADGKTIIAALHDLPVVDRVASNVLCLDPSGPAHTFGPTAAVMTPPRLGSVFGVHVERSADDRLRFSLRRGMTQP